MGIRLAFLTTRAPAASVLAMLSARYGPIPEATRRVNAEESERLRRDVLLVSEWEGLCVVRDPELVLGSDEDLAVEAARVLGVPVAALVTESTTETHQLVVADAKGLCRAFFLCGEQGTGPAYLGEPLASESQHPLDDTTGGEEILDLLAAEGFDVLAAFEHAQWSVHQIPQEWLPVAESPGEVATALQAEIKRGSDESAVLQSPKSKAPMPKPVPKPPAKGGWLKRLFGA